MQSDDIIVNIWKSSTEGVLLNNIYSDLSLYPMKNLSKKKNYLWNKSNTKFKGLHAYIHNPNKPNTYKAFKYENNKKDYYYKEIYSIIIEASNILLHFIKSNTDKITNEEHLLSILINYINYNKMNSFTINDNKLNKIEKNNYIIKHNFFLLRIVIGPISKDVITKLIIYKDLLNIFNNDLLFNTDHVHFVYEIHIKFNINRPLTIIEEPYVDIRCIIFTHCQSYCMQKIYLYPFSPTGGDSFFYYINKTLKISGITQRNVHLFFKRQLQTQLQRNVFKLPTQIRNVRNNYFKHFNTLNIDLIDLTNYNILSKNWGIPKASLYILVCVEIDSGICAARWMPSKEMIHTTRAMEGILIEFCIMYGFLPGIHLKNLTADAGKEFNNLSKKIPLLRVTTNKLLSNAHVENINKQICRRIFNKYIIPLGKKKIGIKMMNRVLQDAVDNINHSYNTGIVHRFGKKLMFHNKNKSIFTPYSLIHEYLVHPDIKQYLINLRNKDDIELISKVRNATKILKDNIVTKDEFSLVNRKIQNIKYIYNSDKIQSWFKDSINYLHTIHLKHLNDYKMKHSISTNKTIKISSMLLPLKNLSLVRVLIDDTVGSAPFNNHIKEKSKRLIRKNVHHYDFYKGYRSHWSYIPYIILKSIKITENRNMYLIWPFNNFALHVHSFLLNASNNHIDNKSDRIHKIWWKQFLNKKEDNDIWYTSLGPWKDYMNMQLHEINNIISLDVNEAKKWKFRDEIQSISIYTNQNCILNPLMKQKYNKHLYDPLYIQFHQWVTPLEHSNKKSQIINVPDMNIDWYDNSNIITSENIILKNKDEKKY